MRPIDRRIVVVGTGLVVLVALAAGLVWRSRTQAR